MDGEERLLESAGGVSTVGSLWHEIGGRELGDELLEWAPDLFAFTDVVLDRSEAYRFAVSPPHGASWPPSEMPDWDLAIADASAGWCRWVEGDGTELPGLISGEWAVVCERWAATLEELATGRAWRLCQAVLTLHAIADEAAAGTGAAVADVPRGGHRFRARARELLARTGTLSRISRERLRVLPCVRNPVGGPSIRSLVALRLRPAPRRRRGLEPDPSADARADPRELTILTGWAEAVAETLTASPDRLTTILDEARAGAPWRRQLGVAEPSAALASALEDLAGIVVPGSTTVEAALATLDERPCGDDGHLARAVLRSTLARRAPGA